MNHFEPREFNCPCCGENKMNVEFLLTIDELREEFGAPLHINSGYRCPKHNAEVGGVSSSQHLQGKACDLSTVNMTAEQRHALMLLIKKKFKGIGVGKTFTHVDIREKPAFWVY